VAGHSTQRVRDLRAVFMTSSEVQLKEREAFTNNLHTVLYKTSHARELRGYFFIYVRNSINRWPVLYISEHKEYTYVIFCDYQRETLLDYKTWSDF
jgi:hypothetical protein